MSTLVMRDVHRVARLPDGSPLPILTGVDLDVATGEHVAVVGRSGSGKSTLLNLLGLLDVPTAGEYEIDGRSAASTSARARARLRGETFGFVFQQFNLLPRRTAAQNVGVPLLYARGADFWRRDRLARQALEQVGLSARAGAVPESLSGGEQQRVSIARALVRRPRVVLADEPTGSLDVDTGTEVMDLLERVCREQGTTLVTITHDLSVAARAGRALRLDHGHLAPIPRDRLEAATAVRGLVP